MVKNLISGPILAGLAQIWGHEISFVSFTSTRCQILSQVIIASNFKENLWSKLKKMPKTPHLKPDLGPLGPNSGR